MIYRAPAPGNGTGLSAETERDAQTHRFLELVSQLDDEEVFMFLHFMRLTRNAKSKSWATRRMNEFKAWAELRRGAKMRAHLG